ncbi:MAG TPA: DUF5668 domain-containing protein [Bacillota bacterium]|nr:DUF5668 domain-containing protein [Bacillota bacterium]HPT86606.1 DUF5668 domain-containing protein [Bacillota bacterium]
MNKIRTATVLILIGVVLLLRNFGILPLYLCRVYLELARMYWPVLLILAGFKVIAGSKRSPFGEAIGWLITILLLLWVICSIWVRQELVI